MERTYEKALTQVDVIFNYIDKELLDRIPQKFKDFVKTYKSNQYQFVYNSEKALNEQDIMQETKAILSLVYRDYLCVKEEKEILNEQDKEAIKKIQKAKEEKYKYEGMFKNPESKLVQEEPQHIEQALITTEKSLWKKIIDKIKKVFMR